MRIAIVTTWFERGAAYVSKQIADTLLASGQSVFIYARGGEEIASESFPWTNYTVERDNTPRLPMPTGMNKKRFTQFLRKNAIDLVIFNEQRYWAPILWTREFGIPSVAYIDYYTTRTVSLFSAYDALICNTNRHYSVFKHHRSCFYIPWGTDTTQFSPDRPTTAKEKFTFFHSAGMNPYRKGTDLLIQAANQLSKRRSDFSVLIHTQVPLEKFFPELRPIFNDLTKRGILSIEHRTVSAPGLYHRGKIYVYPSRLDGIGLTVPEALSCGLPTITSDSAPMNEFLSNECGKLVPIASTSLRKDGYYWPETTCNVEDLTKIMASYCQNEPAIKLQAVEARRRATAHLDWSVNSRDLAQLLQGVTLRETTSEMTKELTNEDHKTVLYYDRLSFLYNAFFRVAIAAKNLLK